MRQLISIAVMGVLALGAAGRGHAETAALLRSGMPEADTALESALAGQLQAAGYTVAGFSFQDLSDPARLTAEAVDLLVLPDASALPAPSSGVIERYLKAGGDILALNAPLWRRVLIQDGPAWVTREAYREKHQANLLQRALFDFAPGALEGWHRNSNDLTHEAQYEIQSGLGAPADSAMHAKIGLLDNWETQVSPALDHPFPAGHTLTVFWAKGGPQTTELSIEWNEQDGSRWIGTVPLTGEWQLFVMEPKDFRYWESAPARANTVFQPENAVKVSIGLALSHNRLSGDKHEYWVGPFGTAERSPEHEKLLSAFKAPQLDTLSPGYKFFECRDVAAVTCRDASGAAPVPAVLRSPHPRAGGAGFDKGRDWRWKPLAEAYAKDGTWRGAPGALTVHAAGPYKGGVWAAFGIEDPQWYLSPAVQEELGALLKQIHYGVFLVDGGGNFYTYFEDQPIHVGLRAVNLGRAERTGLEAALRVRPREPKDAADTWSRILPVTLPPGGEVRVAEEAQLASLHAEAYVVSASLTQGQTVIDRVEHPIHLWKPKARTHFITRQGGDFELNGQRWRAHGVNYMPSSGVATEDGVYFEQWLGARSYDPEIIRRDLAHVKDMGLNALSVFLYRQSMEAQNLLDFLRIADDLGLKVNLSLRPGSPMAGYDVAPIKEMIAYYHLPEWDTVFAYDLDWEPMFPNHDARKVHDPAWRAWVAERYGSIENAEKDWGFAAPRDEQGLLTNPLGEQTVKDGDWRRMTAAYRRFLDTLLYERYGAARRAIQEADPRHLVSFRMAEAGNPTFHWDKAIPYDFAYLGGAVDILEPEAYGRIGDWEKVKPGRFEYEYARWAAPERPLMWAEMGNNAWVESRMQAPADRLAFQSEYFTHFYRMLIESGADGVFFWWYPGGYRVGENSDYGIIEPDGTDRPVTRVIREQAQAFLNGPDAKPVDQWVAVDRDAHPDGIGAIYDALKEAYWRGVAAGKTPGLTTAGTGSTSADCPLVAVGNVPCNGNNPPKYLDGFFDTVEYRNGDGQWVPVPRGGTVEAPRGAAFSLRVGLSNLGEARWLTEGSGAVHVLISAAGETAKKPLPNPMGKFDSCLLEFSKAFDPARDKELEVSLTLEAEGRTAFGPKYTIMLK